MSVAYRPLLLLRSGVYPSDQYLRYVARIWTEDVYLVLTSLIGTAALRTCIMRNRVMRTC